MPDLELTICQYLDGSLAGEERRALEARLATDAEATALLEEHRRLDHMLKGSPLPAIRWDALAQHLSAAIADEAMPEAAEESGRSLRMPWVGFGGRIAMAASVLIAAGVGFALLGRGQGKTSSSTSPTVVAIQQAGFIEVTGPSAELSAAPAAVEVSVGPSQSAGGDSMLARYSDEVITRPSHVMVASGANPVQNSDTLAFDMQ